MAIEHPRLPPLLVDSQGAAYVLSVSDKHVRNMDQCALIPAPVRLGKRKLWVISELHEWALAGAPSRERWEQLKKAAS